MAAEEVVINLDSTTSEEEDDEEEGEIQEDELNEIGTAAASGDDPNEEDMDLGDDDVVLPKQRHSPVLHTSRLSSSTVIQSSTEIAYTDQAPGRGAKRARVERAESEPSVRVVFSFLTSNKEDNEVPIIEYTPLQLALSYMMDEFAKRILSNLLIICWKNHDALTGRKVKIKHVSTLPLSWILSRKRPKNLNMFDSI